MLLGHFQILRIMMYSILIGSYARGDYNANSDCDVVLINNDESNFDKNILSISNKELINFISYDNSQFKSLYDSGSLFIYHVLNEGIVLDGDIDSFTELRKKFNVQEKFTDELNKIHQTTQLLSEIEIFGGKYLTPLVNAFTELKNACIFYLAHHCEYEFNKELCFDKALSRLGYNTSIKQIKAFYDYSIRNIDLDLPFNPNDKKISSPLLLESNKIVRDMYYACC